jgi:hypothetical protein
LTAISSMKVSVANRLAVKLIPRSESLEACDKCSFQMLRKWLSCVLAGPIVAGVACDGARASHRRGAAFCFSRRRSRPFNSSGSKP